MRDRINSPSDGFESFHAPRLSPAEGLESDMSLFTSPPIEALELLSELGQIAAESFRGTEAFIDQPAENLAPATPDLEALTSSAKPAPVTKSADERLVDALLEYHHLRGPKLGARTAPRPTGGTGDRFSSIEIPVIQDAVPKTVTSGIRSSRPVQSILKPKPRP